MQQSSGTRIVAWGNGLAMRLTKPQAAAARLAEGTEVKLHIEVGRIVIEARREPTLAEMLKQFDPKLHGGEMGLGPDVGAEVPG